jgi:pyroglutamyl-peptidase
VDVGWRLWVRLAAGLLLAAITVAGLWKWRRTAVQQESRVCLLTGFEPFGGDKTNASWEMLQPLAGQTIAGYRIVTARLPVVYDELAQPLREAIEKHRPELVICFGLGGLLVDVELLARNGYDLKQPLDNRGRPPPRAEILPGGQTEIPTQLPAAAILRALKDARIGARESRDPGGYLCNECFYRLMALDQRGQTANFQTAGDWCQSPPGPARGAGDSTGRGRGTAVPSLLA